ncbi:MAG: hypothetical protein HFE80_11645 [Clostridiaceae bacterium]|nr:hypothetical protein [Clostridiaceae bacterium]
MAGNAQRHLLKLCFPITFPSQNARTNLNLAYVFSISKSNRLNAKKQAAFSDSMAIFNALPDSKTGNIPGRLSETIGTKQKTADSSVCQ